MIVKQVAKYLKEKMVAKYSSDVYASVSINAYFKITCNYFCADCVYIFVDMPLINAVAYN